MTTIRNDLDRIFGAALDAVAPDRLVARALEGAIPGGERVPAIIADARGIYLLAVGKAALKMAVAAEQSLGSKLLKGSEGIRPHALPAAFQIDRGGRGLALADAWVFDVA